MRKASRIADSLFENGPLLRLQRYLGLVSGEQLNVGRCAVVVVAVGWLPLVILAEVQSVLMHTDGISSLVWEAGAHARYLLAAPFLVLAEVGCARRLNGIAQHFINAGIVHDKERKHFDAAISSTRRLLNSVAAEVVVIVLAGLLVAAIVFSQPFDQFPAWHKTGGVAPAFSPAGWWHVLVSLPLLLVLILGWMWRLVLWARFLGLVARLDLHLIASHPDHTAGLGFVGYSVRAFSIVALALATIVAGRSAHTVLHGGELPTQYLIFNGGVLLAIFAIFSAPLLVFTPTMMNVWQHGSLAYSALADRVGTAFEKKWIGYDGQVDKAVLDKPDFSATTDLYSIVANVHGLRLVPIDFKSVMFLSGAMLLPFIPVVFLALPADQIAAGLKKLLF